MRPALASALVLNLALITPSFAQHFPSLEESCGPVHAAVLQGRLEVLQALQPGSPGLNAFGHAGWCAARTPLMMAVQRGKLDAVKVLLERGADVNWAAVEPFGRVNALCLAVADGETPISTYLRDHGAEDTFDGCLSRVMQARAIKQGDVATLQRLRKDNHGLSPATLRSFFGHQHREPANDALWTELVQHLPVPLTPDFVRLLGDWLDVQRRELEDEKSGSLSRLHRPSRSMPGFVAAVRKLGVLPLSEQPPAPKQSTGATHR